ncbi:MAG: hypothetical protein WA172_12855 [Terriglobales bacterium]
MSLTVEQLNAGIHYWRTTDWPQDFHNEYYQTVVSSLRPKDGRFDLEWWDRFCSILRDWAATRPDSRLILTMRTQERFEQLERAWATAVVPHLQDDIEKVEWRDISDFPALVTQIKVLKYPSPVFTSKFCHFLVPRIFPIVDNKAMGNPYATYEEYYTTAREEWLSTDGSTQAELTRVLMEAIGAPVFSGFPMKCKLVELCLMGRHNRGTFAV